MFPTLHGIRYACVISLRNFSALLRSCSSPSSCVEPLLYSSCAWSRSTRLLAGLCSVAAALAETASTTHCTVSREYFVGSGNSCLCCRALRCAGSAAGGQPVLWEWSWAGAVSLPLSFLGGTPGKCHRLVPQSPRLRLLALGDRRQYPDA